MVEVKVTEAALTSKAEWSASSVYFDGPADPLLPQRAYAVEHEQMGMFDLLIVPLVRQQQGCRYEAVFNYF